MGYYLFQAAYSVEAWAAMVKNPQNRLEAVQPVAKKLGGTLENAWLAFGDYDVVAIFKMPDNVSAAALSVAATASGALKTAKTTPLLTVEEGMEAMRKAGASGYRRPS